MKVITSSGTVDTNQIKNSYGGDIIILNYPSGPTRFYITLTKIPTDACAMLITTDWGYNDNFRRIYVNNNTADSLDILARACKDGGNTNTIRMVHN